MHGKIPRCWVGLLLAIMMALGTLGGCRDGRLRAQLRIEPGDTLKIHAYLLNGGLKIKGMDRPRDMSPVDEMIELEGLNYRRDSIELKNGVYEITGESASVVVSSDRAIELDGYVDDVVLVDDHKAPFTIKDKTKVGSLKILDHAGKIKTGSVIQDLEIMNQIGEVSLDNIVYHARVRLRGDFRASHVNDLDLDCIDGDTSITAFGRVKISNFDLHKNRTNWFDPKKVERAEIEKELDAAGHNLYLMSYGGHTELSVIFAKHLTVRADSGLAMAAVYALDTKVSFARAFSLGSVHSPLKMTSCTNGVLNTLLMPYTMEDCSEIQVNARDKDPAPGMLKNCRNIVYWNTPAGGVTQEKCQNVILPGPKAPPASKPGKKP